MRVLLTLLLPVALVLAAGAVRPVAAAGPDPDRYDPLLDDAPRSDPREERLPSRDPRVPGFVLSTHFGLYLGDVRSFLTSESSRLESAARGALGLGIGYRTPSLIELGLDVDLGLGQTHEPKTDDTVFAFDVLVQPRIFAHAYETESFSFYAGVAGDVILFDLGGDGLNQGGVGPALLVGVHYRTDRHSLFYLEASADYFYDFLAYRFEPVEEDDEDPAPSTEEVRKIEGEWYNIFRLTLGYRLTGFGS